MERHDACPAFHDRFLESHLRLAEGTVLNHVTSKWALMITSAAAPMASLPPVGTHGRNGPAREHDTLHGEQILGFWRAWHRQCNLWIVRYLYIPLGGARRLAATSILMIFTFITLWHNLSPRLLAWGWVAALFILPEVVAKKTFPPSLVRIYLVEETSLLMFFVLCSSGIGGGTAMRVQLVECSTSC